MAGIPKAKAASLKIHLSRCRLSKTQDDRRSLIGVQHAPASWPRLSGPSGAIRLAASFFEIRKYAVTGFDRMEDQLAYLIASVNRQLEEQLAEVLRADGIAIEQFRVISALSSSDGRSMRDLASVVFVDPATLTKIVDRMVAEAMVYRAPDPKDRRKVLIFLASKGQALYACHRKTLDEQQKRLVERLSAAKVDEFTVLLKNFDA